MRPLLVLATSAFLLVVAPARAQDAVPCSAPEARQLDFWLGSWNLTWEGGQGTNEIVRRFGDCVIEENFVGQMPDGPYRGFSVSMFDRRSKEWRQTWVDDQGSYLAFRGGRDGDGFMRLCGEPLVGNDGREQISRMSWINVEKDSLDWLWERSFDGGATWEMFWEIHYERASRHEAP